MKILATGLAAGILLDATVVRALLVPALVSMFGRWNWWMPPRVARVLRVRPGARAGGGGRAPLSSPVHPTSCAGMLVLLALIIVVPRRRRVSVGQIPDKPWAWRRSDATSGPSP